MARSRRAILILAFWLLATFAGPVVACVPSAASAAAACAAAAGMDMARGKTCCCAEGRGDSHHAQVAASVAADPCACAIAPGAPATAPEPYTSLAPAPFAALQPATFALQPPPSVAAAQRLLPFVRLPHRPSLPLAPDAGRAPPFA